MHRRFTRIALIPLLFGCACGVAPAQEATPSGDELRTAVTNLKAAEEQKDSDLIKKYAVETSNLARKIIASPQPAGLGEADAWKATVDYAKEVAPQADYSLYNAAVRAKDRVQVMDLFEALEKQSPKSPYVSQLYGVYVAALSQGGNSAKAFDFATKALARDPNNEELLLVLADGAMTRKLWDRAATYGTKLASVMTSHPKPEGMTAGEWEKRRTQLTGRGYWAAGMSYASVNKFTLADKNLRAALPLIKGDDLLMSGALFYLGVADYNLARATQDKVLMKQALAYSEEAFKAGGQYSQPANQNVYAIKQELARMR